LITSIYNVYVVLVAFVDLNQSIYNRVVFSCAVENVTLGDLPVSNKQSEKRAGWFSLKPEIPSCSVNCSVACLKRAKGRPQKKTFNPPRSPRAQHQESIGHFTVECPTGSGRKMNLHQMAEEIGRQLTNIFLRDKEDRRPVNEGTRKFREDPHWRGSIVGG
jgi:hypothetical protein